MAKVISITAPIYEVEETRHRSAPPIKYIIDENKCHICISHAVDKDGYPRIRRGKDHRMSHHIWELATGQKFPVGMVLMHTCDNPTCINPEHLKLGTQKENMADRKSKGRYNKNCDLGRTKLTPEQIYYIKRVSEETDAELAIKFGVYETEIKRIRRWKKYDSVINNITTSNPAESAA